MLEVIGNIGVAFVILGFAGIMAGMVAMLVDGMDWADCERFIVFGFIGGFFLMFLGAIAVVPALVQASNAEQAVFMKACMADHKEYECQAMRRAGDSHTTVMPMPIIIGR